ncbi:FtsW/RodA/SpoVE family cell cycle protein [Paenibacillus sp. GCM10027626]|uniref:FtsW/RodA/SpoVE family cell cycle protein n=1 Tax=Paenibacillus sp. GCM10027626 TaxID=3273411 RepID=UPI0036450724
MIFLHKLNKVDRVTLLIVACLLAIGTVAIYGATHGTKLDGLHISNLIWIGAFSVLMLFVALFDYRLLLGRISYLLYAFGVGLLVLVQFRGEDANGAVRWLSIGSFQIQPSEMAKLFTVLLVAHLLQRRAGERLRLIQDVLPILIVFAVPMLFVVKQPDLGTALVFVGILIGMLWIGNIRAIYMMLCLGAVTLAVVAVIYLFYENLDLLSKFVKPHQLSRIETFLDPTSDPDKAWHVKNAMSAIGVGGFSGDGDGFYSRQGYIPYAYSDSIYVVIGEFYGFLGSAVLLVLYFLLVYRMVMIAVENQGAIGGSFLVVGVISMFVFQVFVNIGMHIGLLPLTGISLPFISYGGSSLLTNMIAIGLVLSVKIHQDEY